ncbi:MAG: helix-turn-helix domain-containing protein [Elusimicrobia bacterium]|nr:helix-turn-helix domain-containing protein [Elusimicrobiota bacterium]
MTGQAPFVRRVAEGMRRSGLTLRSFCREVELDPSFFSKVLSGKRSPPSEEEVLRRIAARLSLDAAELIVAAGRIPSEWQALWKDPELFNSTNEMVTGRNAGSRFQRQPRPKVGAGRMEREGKTETRPIIPARRQEMSEELL